MDVLADGLELGGGVEAAGHGADGVLADAADVAGLEALRSRGVTVEATSP